MGYIVIWGKEVIHMKSAYTAKDAIERFMEKWYPEANTSTLPIQVLRITGSYNCKNKE